MREDILSIERDSGIFKLYINGEFKEEAKVFKPYHLLNLISKDCRELFNTNTDEYFEQEIKAQ